MIVVGVSLLVGKVSIAQSTTSGTCSPIVSQVGGNVRIECNSIPDSALNELVEQIRLANDATQEAQRKADDWAERYFLLSSSIQTISASLGSDKVGPAAEALLKGQLDAAAATIGDLERSLAEQRSTYKKSAIQLLDLLYNNSVQFGGVLERGLLWDSGVSLSICFFDGDAELRRSIVDTGAEWTMYGNITFDVGPQSVPRSCDPKNPSDVRISTDGFQYWSYVGNHARTVPQDRPTMTLGTRGTLSPSSKVIVLHEFGHMLGLQHVYVQSSACSADLNWEYIDGVLGGPPNHWSKDQIRRNLAPIEKISEVADVGVFDVKSVMGFRLPEEYFLSGKLSPCYVESIDGLSPLDKLTMYNAYPLDREPSRSLPSSSRSATPFIQH